MDEEATHYRGTDMPMAFVLINTEMGSENEILDSLLKIVNVKIAYVVYGVYDVIALVEAETMEQLKDIITWRIRRLNNVHSTLTTMVVQENKTK